MTPQVSFDDLHSLAVTLAAGFESLSTQVEQQQEVEHGLRLRLQRAAKQYEEDQSTTDRSSAEISDWRDEIVKQISPCSDQSKAPRSSPDADEKIAQAKIALTQLRDGGMPSRMEPRKCPIAHNVVAKEPLERDFTTVGKPSDLACPFANNGNVSNIEDPIAAEFHGDRSSSRSQDAASRCPIRFLGKHSPEEIAQYFENHKHEIPRSHQICVKRYQTNEQSVRQIDAKYGNMVSMIQGLGNKHKQYLPEGDKAEEAEKVSNKVVEKWAENVSQHSNLLEETERIPRFDKELRDIRVGESPSRPWGIPVPVDKSSAASAAPSVNERAKSVKPPSSAPAPVIAEMNQVPQPKEPSLRISTTSPAPQVVFNGPVFFGYSAEQAAMFLQSLNLSKPA